MLPSLTLFSRKGSALTAAEMDANWSTIRDWSNGFDEYIHGAGLWNTGAQTAFSNYTFSTAPAAADEIMLNKGDGSGIFKVTVQNFVNLANSITENNSPLPVDKFAYYDVAAGTGKATTFEYLWSSMVRGFTNSAVFSDSDKIAFWDTSEPSEPKIRTGLLSDLTTYIASAKTNNSGIDSEDHTIASAITTWTWAHGLSGVPSSVNVCLVCETDDTGASTPAYTSGEVVDAWIAQYAVTADYRKSPIISVVRSDTTVAVTYKGSVAWYLPHRTTASDEPMTKSKWKLRIYASL